VINADRHADARVVASIEARMGSSRLPGKVLMDVAGKPALTRLVERLRCCRQIDDIVLATSTAPADDALEAWAQEIGCAFYRGSEEDVLDRVVAAQRQMRGNIVVEVTGDCTLLDPIVIDMGVETFFANDCDVVNNFQTTTYPEGVDVQVFCLDDLVTVADTVTDPAVREHVSLYFYENPELYRILTITAPMNWQGKGLRFQLDYPEDHAFISAIYERLEPIHGPAFGLDEIMPLLASEPALTKINAHCVEKLVR
jgi:spore coat polysaccharide biosynthesis protein SpsF